MVKALVMGRDEASKNRRFCDAINIERFCIEACRARIAKCRGLPAVIKFHLVRRRIFSRIG
jgi:hypothetical protein